MKHLLSIILFVTLSITTSISFSEPSSNESQTKNVSAQALPKLNNGRNYNIFVFGDLIYWRMSSPNLVYGRDGVSNTFSGNQITTAGKSYYPDYNYYPGFRAGIGTKFGPGKAFDLVALYTQINPTPSSNTSPNQFSGLFIPLNWFSGSTTTNTFTFGSLGLNLNLQLLELQSGYAFPINEWLGLRPYIALTSYLINGDITAKYSFTNGSGIQQLAKTQGNCHSWSVGPKVGLDVFGHFTKNWGLFTNVAFTQQTSNVKMTTQEFITTPSTHTVFLAQNGRVSENNNFALIGLEIGPTWDNWFNNNRYHLQIRATYSANNLVVGTNFSFLNSNNQDLLVTSAFRGFNLRTLFEF